MRERQKVFVAEYLKCLDGKQAAIAAGYKPSGAESQATKLLRHTPAVRVLLNQEIAARNKRTEITLDWVLVSLQDCFLRAYAEGDWRSAIAALVQLGRHTGGFVERIDARVMSNQTVKFIVSYEDQPKCLPQP